MKKISPEALQRLQSTGAKVMTSEAKQAAPPPPDPLLQALKDLQADRAQMTQALQAVAAALKAQPAPQVNVQPPKVEVTVPPRPRRRIKASVVEHFEFGLKKGRIKDVVFEELPDEETH